MPLGHESSILIYLFLHNSFFVNFTLFWRSLFFNLDHIFYLDLIRTVDCILTLIVVHIHRQVRHVLHDIGKLALRYPETTFQANLLVRVQLLLASQLDTAIAGVQHGDIVVGAQVIYLSEGYFTYENKSASISRVWIVIGTITGVVKRFVKAIRKVECIRS